LSSHDNTISSPTKTVHEQEAEHGYSIDGRDDGSYYMLLGCNSESPTLLADVFDDRDVAQAWVEDKARLLVRGIKIASQQRWE